MLTEIPAEKPNPMDNVDWSMEVTAIQEPNSDSFTNQEASVTVDSTSVATKLHASAVL